MQAGSPQFMKLYLLVGLAGGFGAMARFALTSWLASTAGRGFPWGTLSVNVIGSGLMGFLGIWLMTRWQLPMEYRLAILTGFLGAFTTMSAFSIDALALMQRQAWVLAAIYVVGTILLCLVAARGGMLLAERLAS
ncbi:fluoride efflux transporter CrcB [Guyparkeria sp.]|uniref:fluoride efflux transporter CrcB n=1 Tax=Guyparkeria sp. TaxID=2035736 RepID=UPI00356AE474